MNKRTVGILLLTAMMLGVGACGSVQGGNASSAESAAAAESAGVKEGQTAKTGEAGASASDAASDGAGAAAGGNGLEEADTTDPAAFSADGDNADTDASAGDTAAVGEAASDADGSVSDSDGAAGSSTPTELDKTLAKRDETINFTVDGTKIHLGETLQELLDTDLVFVSHDDVSGKDTPVDAAFAAEKYSGEPITITTTDSSGNPVSVSLWDKWLDEEYDSNAQLNVMNIGIVDPAPVSWSQATYGPYGMYIGMSGTDLEAAAGKPDSKSQFVRSPLWLYDNDYYSLTVSVSDGVIKGMWIDDNNKARHTDGV